MGRRKDGSYQSANNPSRAGMKAEQTTVDNGTYRCLVIEVRYTDDDKNLTFENKQVTYDCLILGGKDEGQIIPNCKLAAHLGGQYNYHERILRKTTKAFSTKSERRLSNQDGDIVYVEYVGKTTNPIIIGMGTHPKDKTTTGATKNDGPIDVYEYNGVHTKIDKNGNYEFIRKGGVFDATKGYFVPADRSQEEDRGSVSDEQFQARVRFTSNQMIWEDPKSNITLLKNEQKYTMNIGTSGTKIDVDGAGGIITVEANGGNVITIDKSGQVTIKASSKVNIEAPLVDVGEGASLHSTLFENLASEFKKHIHAFDGAAITTDIVTGPETVTGFTGKPAAPLISLVGSQTVRVKD